MSSIGLIFVAGGLGKRLSKGLPKQFLDLQGKPLFVRALEPFLKLNFDCIAMTFPSDFLEVTNSILDKFALMGKVNLVEGGAERYHSVWNALNFEGIRSCDYVLIHDAVRPFVSVEFIQKIIGYLVYEKAIIPAILSKDTIKQVNSERYVYQTLNRETCLLVQTPQAFETEYLYHAYDFVISHGIHITDDASAIEQIGGKVKVIDGEEYNFKITNPIDLEFAEFIAGKL
jgi:2-C-methyl-D-erythritol 4-phosphate cytidylyltransferase